jgi:hypothetical protein
LQFHVTLDAEGIRARVAELDEIVVPAAVRELLRGVRQIVAIEMAHTQLDTMFEMVAFEIAYWLCETRGGVILGPHDHWFDHDTYRWKPFAET